ncbi:AP endonuclease 1, binding site [Phytophthora cactorum]|nr:AP endonuclease 1, binding site [Phytophthora cactorum]
MKRELQLVTWNVNGLRAVLQRLEQSLHQFLESLEADIICLQETKMTRSELDEELVRPPGEPDDFCRFIGGVIRAFYSFCRHRGGYSGVVTFVKSDLPTVAAEEGLTGLLRTKDSVGHVGSLHDELPSKLVNDLELKDGVSSPTTKLFSCIRGSPEYKLQFHALLEDRVSALQAANKRVIVVGDINIAHREIDHCDPHAHRSDGSSFGDHPCRKWMDSFVGVSEEISLSEPKSEDIVDGAKLIDTYRALLIGFRVRDTRYILVLTIFLSFIEIVWNTQTGARQTNYGARIDYILVDPTFVELYPHAGTPPITNGEYWPLTICLGVCCMGSIDAERLGSDHCPVVMSCTVELKTDSSTNLRITAALCAKNFVEFSGHNRVSSHLCSKAHIKCDRHQALRNEGSSQLRRSSVIRTKRKPARSPGEESATYRMYSSAVRIVERQIGNQRKKENYNGLKS